MSTMSIHRIAGVRYHDPMRKREPARAREERPAARATDVGPNAFDAFKEGGIALVFASVPDEELEVMQDLAREGLRWSVRTRRNTSPGPAYDQYVTPICHRLGDELEIFCEGDGGPTWYEPGAESEAVLPAGPLISRARLHRFISGGATAESWATLREVMVVALRLAVFECHSVLDEQIDVESLRVARENIMDFLNMLIAYLACFEEKGSEAKKKQRELALKMSQWVAEVGSPWQPRPRFSGFDPQTGRFAIAEPQFGDLWAVLMRSLNRLLSTFGTAGLGRCRRCGWFFHQALWLYTHRSGAGFCSVWCKRNYHNPRRLKKRQLR